LIRIGIAINADIDGNNSDNFPSFDILTDIDALVNSEQIVEEDLHQKEEEDLDRCESDVTELVLFDVTFVPEGAFSGVRDSGDFVELFTLLFAFCGEKQVRLDLEGAADEEDRGDDEKK